MLSSPEQISVDKKGKKGSKACREKMRRVESQLQSHKSKSGLLLPKKVSESQMFFLCSGAGGKKNVKYMFMNEVNHKINLLAKH